MNPLPRRGRFQRLLRGEITPQEYVSQLRSASQANELRDSAQRGALHAIKNLADSVVADERTNARSLTIAAEISNTARRALNGDR